MIWGILERRWSVCLIRIYHHSILGFMRRNTNMKLPRALNYLHISRAIRCICCLHHQQCSVRPTLLCQCLVYTQLGYMTKQESEVMSRLDIILR